MMISPTKITSNLMGKPPFNAEKDVVLLPVRFLSIIKDVLSEYSCKCQTTPARKMSLIFFEAPNHEISIFVSVRTKSAINELIYTY